VAAAAATPGGGGAVLDPTGDRDGGGGVDGQGGAEVAAGDRGGLGELILPLQPLRAMHPLPVLREGQPAAPPSLL
jgi:hypothetical protein